MKETRWINLEDLDEIIGVYGIRKDIRARAAIENQAVSGQIFHWTLAEDDIPENDNEVLVCVNMRTEDGLQMGAIEKASFFHGVGWILHSDPDAEFTVIKWAALPK